MKAHHFVIILGLFVWAPGVPGVQSGRLTEAENNEVQNQCGKGIDNLKKVYGGEEVASTNEMMREAPWVVSIQINKGNACTGVLFSPRHVLTAAHCLTFEPKGTTCGKNFQHNPKWNRTIKQFTIRAYSKSVREDHADRLMNISLQFKVKKIILPASFTAASQNVKDMRMCPPYNGDTEDIAIFELETPVNRPTFACLSVKNRNSEIFTNYGFGYTGLEHVSPQAEMLRKHNVKHVRCDPNGRSMFHGMHCLRSKTSKKPTSGCSGDSGSPVIANKNGRKLLVGVMTNGQDCAKINIKESLTKHLINQMTSVPHYLNWICQHSGVCPPAAAKSDPRPTNTIA